MIDYNYRPNIDIRFGDCIDGMNAMDPDQIDLTMTSIPFGALFSYSHKDQDIGNNIDGVQMHESQFGLHMRFFVEQLLRVHKPGTIAAIHIQQLLRWKTQHGFMGMRDLRGAVISLMENHGWQPHGEVAICKNPRAVAKRLKLHSLQFATGFRDSRAWSPAMNDYVLLFRKPGEGEKLHALIETDKCVWLEEIDTQTAENDETVIKSIRHPMIEYDDFRKRKSVVENYKDLEYKFHDSKGGFEVLTGGKHINPNGWVTKTDWVKMAHGCWLDILEIDVLPNWKCARDNEEEKHIAPLQLKPIRNIMKMYSKPGDVVLDPFMGRGTTGHVAIEQGRDAIGFELKESYHRMSLDTVRLAFEKFIDGKDDRQLTLDDCTKDAS